ncbi:hypothetical protein [Pseudomonas phage PPpW-3]|uniref:Uncharacterized protein n=1 Tax=Pseudomonas phage PPpW-3 TaxID=1279082 RepID=V5YTK1_9CAUD|nr:hypothetical protein X916_gp43 [Pseudomonas phage PPpW-3]BAO20643.1 hypothetical protein [Pseudomonas phage PPpW-3]
MKEHPFVNVVTEDDSSCQLRRSFWSKDQAVLVQQKIHERTGKLRKIEPKCRYCNGWHLEDAK